MAEGVKLRLGFMMRLRASQSAASQLVLATRIFLFFLSLAWKNQYSQGTSCTGRLGALLARRAAFLKQFLELAEKLRKQTNKQAGYL